MNAIKAAESSSTHGDYSRVFMKQICFQIKVILNMWCVEKIKNIVQIHIQLKVSHHEKCK